MLLETKRMIIQDFVPEDLPDLYDILGDDETMRNCESAYTMEKTKKFLEEFCINKHGAVAAVLKETKKLIGYILFNEMEEEIYEIGWIFHKSYWREGYAYEACSELIRFAFSELKAHKIFAEAIDDVKSVGLMKKLGMTLEGVQKEQTRDVRGNWVDLHLYGIVQNN